eukprot:SAG22_NODE_10530_length_529_cov_1.100000_1_plen_61_part_10
MSRAQAGSGMSMPASSPSWPPSSPPPGARIPPATYETAPWEPQPQPQPQYHAPPPGGYAQP